MTNQNLFGSFVGQNEIKQQLGFYINSFHHTKIFPNMLFASPVGFGKSALVRETARNLYEYDDNGKLVMKEDGITPKKKSFIELNASTIKNARSFVNDILIRHCTNGKRVTLFCDEIHALKDCVAQVLLSVLAPTATGINEFSYDDYLVTINFKHFTFLCATTETDRLFPALLNRLKRIQLQDYTNDDLVKIVQKAAPEVSFIEDTLTEIASVVRGNPRKSVELASDIKAYLCNKTVFGRKQWKEFKSVLSIRKYGLTNAEISLLRFMSTNLNGSSLTNLAAKTGLSRTVIQSDYESYLQRLNLMTIEAGRGRMISGRGLEVLRELDAEIAA